MALAALALMVFGAIECPPLMVKRDLVSGPIFVAVETKSDEKKGNEIIKKQEEMFHNMESQYEVARLATHTHRGLGLGFGTFQPR